MIRRLSRALRRRDDGSAALETVILAPPMLLFIAMAVIGMRIEVTGGSIEGAAHDAARAASIERTPAAATVAATQTARASLARQGLHCAGLRITADTSRFAADPATNTPTVRVDIRCTITFADVTGATGLPGSRRLTATFVSPVDVFRSGAR